MKIVAWNVNGLRAIHGKGFLNWLSAAQPDFVCLQEIKARPEQLPTELLKIDGYHAFFNPAARPGYSGTAVYTRIKPDDVWSGIGEPRFDVEGRVVAVRFGTLHVVSAYFPNAQEGGVRLRFKVDFCHALRRRLGTLTAQGQDVVLAGDYNIAHEEIDLARPDDNHENPGFFPQERHAMTEFLATGFHDVLRERNPGKTGLYTWWSYRTGARARNVGWRIDYTTVSRGLRDRVKKAWIEPEVTGSDHCPVGVEVT
ncbi:MAG TPA: exodeoxyribonuclease III [Planctomycetota bacterium]|nr:exodeoxyribonuclease III [Planctomycetota bacterium]